MAHSVVVYNFTDTDFNLHCRNMRESLIQLVRAHTPVDATEREHAENTLLFLYQNTNCTSTTNLAGHITASAWVLSPCQSATLLTHHRKLDRWLQLGGHIENESNIQEAALREAREESGIHQIVQLQELIFDIDIHLIPARKSVAEHYHYDIRFLFMAEKTSFVVSEESKELAWVELAKVSDLVSDDSMLRMCHKSQRYTDRNL